MLVYSRWAPFDAVDETEVHVRAHLSSVAAEDDDPETNADDVRVRFEDAENDWGVAGIRVIGELDAEASAPYLRPDFDPEQDVAANPLSVPSINGGAE